VSVITRKGLLVVFEGIDGSGKTTQAKLLCKHLEKMGFDALFSKEPTNSIYGTKIKKLAESDRNLTTPVDEYQLFVSDRKFHVKNTIIPALTQKRIVVLDRYYFSTMAYQGARGLDPAKIQAENELFAPVPDIVFLLKIPPNIGLKRIKKGRNEVPNLFEREESLIRVARIFDSIREDYIFPINGSEPAVYVHKTIVTAVDDLLERYMAFDEP
jgi:dTMP kinase